MAINFSFSTVGTAHYAQVIGDGSAKFPVGRETVYEQTQHGLFNYPTPNGAVFNAADYHHEYGFWAYFIAPTAKAESANSFVCLNTYDRARFTFSFMQYAAHVPNGDFVNFFRELLALPKAAEYFPKIALKDKRICYRESSGTLTPLEDDVSTEKLMDYFNPTLDQIETQELICAARMVHWAANDVKHRRLQVKIAVEHFRGNMKQYAASYNLDGYPAKVCQIVCDIRHQGRAKSQQIIDALNTGGNYDKAYNNLLQIGQPLYAARIATVRAVIKALSDQEIFNKTYQKSTNDFV